MHAGCLNGSLQPIGMHGQGETKPIPRATDAPRAPVDPAVCSLRLIAAAIEPIIIAQLSFPPFSLAFTGSPAMSPYPGAQAPVSGSVVELDSTIHSLDMRRPARRISIYRGPQYWDNAHFRVMLLELSLSATMGELSLDDRS